MKKYKLIKTYPGSPVLGFEVEKIGASTYVGGSGNTFQIRKEYIEYHSEFWEKVVEKDYEILCIKHKKNKCFYRNSIDLRNLNIYDIHSVKRLSDGKVFNIGDNATTALNNYGTITAFEIYCNSMYIRTNGSIKGIFSCNIKDLIVSELLFKTEDGVDIFEGDKAYECARNGICYDKAHKFNPLNSEKHNYNSIGKDWVVFSTMEKAEEYILLNKPCICLKDLIETFFPKSYDFSNRKSEGAIEDISVNLLISLFKLKLEEE
jgi:hypothetical protein